MNKKRPSYIPESQWIEDLSSYVLKVAYRYLPLDVYRFRETYRDDNFINFNSEWCRVQFYANWNYDKPGAYEVKIYYARLHAPNRELYMEWQGEKCQCWLEASWNYILE